MSRTDTVAATAALDADARGVVYAIRDEGSAGVRKFCLHHWGLYSQELFEAGIDHGADRFEESEPEGLCGTCDEVAAVEVVS